MIRPLISRLATAFNAANRPVTSTMFRKTPTVPVLGASESGSSRNYSFVIHDEKVVVNKLLAEKYAGKPVRLSVSDTEFLENEIRQKENYARHIILSCETPPRESPESKTKLMAYVAECERDIHLLKFLLGKGPAPKAGASYGGEEFHHMLRMVSIYEAVTAKRVIPVTMGDFEFAASQLRSSVGIQAALKEYGKDIPPDVPKDIEKFKAIRDYVGSQLSAKN